MERRVVTEGEREIERSEEVIKIYIYKWEINNIALILMSLSTHLL